MELFGLNHLSNLTLELNKPLNSTNRIKYTCYDASDNYIVCGAISGSLYIFQRNPCKFLQLIPNLCGAINHVAISPQEQFIAFTTQKGSILIYIIDFTNVQPAIFSSYYHEMHITQLKWKQNETQLYLGDIKGNVFLVNLNNYLGRSLKNITIHPILFLESPIVQICEYNTFLLVSNYTKCILCNTETEEFKQIGNQPRDGRFGACFVATNSSMSREKNTPVMHVVCARPRTRMWECSIDGHVLKTHKFKTTLETQRPTKIFCEEETVAASVKHEINEELMHLQNINDSFVLGHTSNAFYIFDFANSKVVLWNNSFRNIHTVKVVNDSSASTIVLFTDDQKAYTFQLENLVDSFCNAVVKEQYSKAVHILNENVLYFETKMSCLEFRYCYSLLRKRQDQSNENEIMCTNFSKEFDEYIKQNGENDGMNNEYDSDDIIFTNDSSIVENSKSNKTIIKSIMQDTDNYQLDNDDNTYYTKDEFQRQTPAKIIQLEENAFSKDDKVLQNLYFAYKSLKISKFSLRDRYADFFDEYDVQDTKRILSALELMILENDKEVSQSEAKEFCASIYLNYIKVESVKEPENGADSFMIECFSLVNSACNDNQSLRCEFCNFPVAVLTTKMKYSEIAEVLIKQLVFFNDNQRLFDMIDTTPALLTILLKVMASDHSKQNSSDINTSKFEAFIDMFFSTAQKSFIEKSGQQFPFFSSYEFWYGFFSRLIKLYNNESIQCIRCRKLSKVNMKILVHTESFYTYDYAFNKCVMMMNGSTALDLCTMAAKFIPANCIGKQFYIKCLLDS